MMNKTTISLLVLLAIGGCRDDTAERAMNLKRAEELKHLAAGADWWEHQYSNMQSLYWLQPASRPGDDKCRATEESITRIVADTERAGAGAIAGLEAMAASGDVNLRCWALDALGRCGSRSSLELLKKSAKDENWKLRAAAVLAVGRIAAVRCNADLLSVISAGMDDTEPFYTRKDLPRTIGQGGVVEYYLPVVLASLRAACMVSDAAGLEVILKGLRTRPFVIRELDSTPVPFPATVTERLPSWYADKASGVFLALSQRAVPSLLGLAEGPEHRFFVSGGGRYNRPGIMLMVRPGEYSSVHAFAVGCLDGIVGKAEATRLLIALLRSHPDRAANVLHTLSFKVDEDMALAEIVGAANNALFLGAISESYGMRLKKVVNTRLIVERLLAMLELLEDEQTAHRVPMLLGGIDDDRVRASLVAVIPVKDGPESRLAEWRAAGAIVALGNIGNRDSLTLLKNLKFVGDIPADDPWIRPAIDQAIQELETRLRGAKK